MTPTLAHAATVTDLLVDIETAVDWVQFVSTMETPKVIISWNPRKLGKSTNEMCNIHVPNAESGKMILLS